MFLAHVVDVTSSMHAPFAFRSLASKPFAMKLILVPLWPIAFLFMVAMWAKSKTFLVSFYNLRGKLHQTWAVPRFGFHVIYVLFFLLIFIYFFNLVELNFQFNFGVGFLAVLLAIL